MNSRGVALFSVLAMLLIVILLVSAVLAIVSNHSRLANHQVRRTQAYYAAQAGVTYVREQLRLNTSGWVPDEVTPITKYMCRGGTDPLCPTASPGINEVDLPSAVRYVEIVIGPYNATSHLTPVSASANYTTQ